MYIESAAITYRLVLQKLDFDFIAICFLDQALNEFIIRAGDPTGPRIILKENLKVAFKGIINNK